MHSIAGVFQEEKPETTVLLDAIADAMSDPDAGLRSFGAKYVFALLMRVTCV
jgi:hypothetical protein